MPLYADSHAHLNSEDYAADLDQVVEDSHQAGVAFIVDVGTDLETSLRSIELAERFPGVYATVGVHPHEARRYSENELLQLLALHEKPKVVAIGEIGLDYFYDHSPREKQQQLFSLQVEFALRHNRPVIVHARDSLEDALGILAKDFGQFPAGVFHCYTGDYRQAVRILDQGMFLSFGGALTFKKSEPLRELVSKLPLARLLLETDCPWLAPVPYRGKRNSPAHLPLIAAELAKVKQTDVETVGSRTTAAAAGLFGIPLPAPAVPEVTRG
jgi:TatD DNase family protein